MGGGGQEEAGAVANEEVEELTEAKVQSFN